MLFERKKNTLNISAPSSSLLSQPVDDMMRGKRIYFLYTHTKDTLVAKVS